MMWRFFRRRRAKEQYHFSTDTILHLGMAFTAGYLLAGGKIPEVVIQEAFELMKLQMADARLQLLEDRIEAGDYGDDLIRNPPAQ